MDWMDTNAVFDANGVVPWPDSINAANIEWADRPLMTDAQWNKGVPVEAMVELCNLTGADGWFNMPVNASDDYVRQFATYVRDHLNPGLQVHVEFSNEVWNWAFPQSQYALAHDAGFGSWMEWYGVRTAQVGRIWNDVFGESPTGGEDVTGRVHVVYNTQEAWQGLESYGLDTPNWYENGVHVSASDYFDEYAVTGYYNFNTTDHNVVRSWWSNPDGGFDAALASLQQEVDGPLKAAYAYHAGKAAQYGLELTTYESGYGENAPDETADYQQFLIDVQRQPGLYDIEKENYQNFKDAGGDLYMNFGIIGEPSKWGSWSALESLYQETSPRYQALTDWNATVAPWYETGRDPSVFDSSWMLSQNGAPTASNGDTATASIAENTTAVTTATDPNVGQALSYSIVGGADASKFTIGSTGALSFVTAPNFEAPTDAGGNNVYDVIVQASDGHGGIVTHAIAVAVTDVNEAPMITSNGGGDTATASIAGNTAEVTTVTATDPDIGQTLSYSIIGGADASKFNIGASTGALSFVTAPNSELPTDAGGKNVYGVIVQASDGHGGIDTQAITVGVQNAVGVSIHGTAHDDLIDMTHTVPGQPFPTAEGDILNGGPGGDTLAGGPGADTFVFDLTAFGPALPGSGVVDHILDYNQGNSGTFNPAEGDTFDFSALLSAGSGQPVANLVRVTENPSGTAAILQIDRDGIANGAHWTTMAQLDGVHTGDGVKVIFDTSQPVATLTVSAVPPGSDWHLT